MYKYEKEKNSGSSRIGLDEEYGYYQKVHVMPESKQNTKKKGKQYKHVIDQRLDGVGMILIGIAAIVHAKIRQEGFWQIAEWILSFVFIVIGGMIIYYYSKTSTIFNLAKNEVYTEITSCKQKNS